MKSFVKKDLLLKYREESLKKNLNKEYGKQKKHDSSRDCQ